MYHPEGAFRQRHHTDKQFVPVDEIPDPGLNPEEALIREQEEQGEAHESNAIWDAWVRAQLQEMTEEDSSRGMRDWHTESTLPPHDEVTDMFDRLREAHEQNPGDDIQALMDRLNISRKVLYDSWKLISTRVTGQRKSKIKNIDADSKERNRGLSHGTHGREPHDKHHKGGETIRRRPGDF